MQPSVAPARTPAGFAFAASFVLIWVSTMVAQRFNAPSLGSEFAAAALSIVLIPWALRHSRLDRSRLIIAAVASLPVWLMLVSSLLTPSPIEAVLGDGPLWQGWVLWAAALGWFCASLAAGNGRNLKRLLQAMVWAGSITATWALIESLGVLGTYQVRTGLAAMAMFDSPMSMGQVLVLTICATLSMAARTHATPRTRMIHVMLALLQAAALFAGGARAAMLGIAVGAAALGVLTNGRSVKDRLIRLVSIGILATFAVGLCYVGAAWSGALGRTAFVQADQVLTGRLSIWNDVGERVEGNAIIGAGLRPFDSIISWDAMADGRVAAEITYDQHSILFTWLMSTGVLGLLAFGSAAVLLGMHIIRAARDERATMSARILAAGGVAVFVSMLTSWPEPVAVLGVSLLSGALITNGSLSPAPAAHHIRWRSPVLLVPAVGGVAAAILAFVAFLPAVNARVDTSYASDYPTLVREIEAALLSTHDYSYLTHELTLIERQGPAAVSDADAVQMLRELAAEYPEGACCRVEVPLLALDILYERSASMSPDEFWELSRFYADRGAEADPSSAVWQYERARAAYTAHRSDAESYIAAALKANPPESASMYLRHLN